VHKAGMCGLANHSRAFRGFKVEVKAHLSIHRLKFRLLGQCDGGAGTSAYRARNAASLREPRGDSRRGWNEIAKSKEFHQKISQMEINVYERRVKRLDRRAFDVKL
jgi:hypothetical protein